MKSICAGCSHEIDPEVCWCGQSIDHGYDNHPPIPMGCDCYRDNRDEVIETLKDLLDALENTGAAPDEPLRVAIDDGAEGTATIREVVAGCDGVLIVLSTE